MQHWSDRAGGERLSTGERIFAASVILLQMAGLGAFVMHLLA